MIIICDIKKFNEMKTERLTEGILRRIIAEEIKKETGRKKLVESDTLYGYPETVDRIILDSDSNEACRRQYDEMARRLATKDFENLTVERLENSSWMRKYQQLCFRMCGYDQDDIDPRTSPRLFRHFVAERMIEEIKDGDYS